MKTIQGDVTIRYGRPVHSAFLNCTRLTSIVFGSSLENIGDYAFFGCTGLRDVIIPKSVKTIGDSAFRNCAVFNGGGLTNVVIESGSALETIGTRAFANGYNLTSINLPESLKTIGSSAFINCRLLKSIVIPGGVTTIEDCAFQDCWALESVTLPDTLTSIGLQAFSFDKSLETIVIPDSVKTIGERAFSSCTALKTVTMPASVTSVHESAFNKCDALETIILTGDTAPGVDIVKALQTAAPNAAIEYGDRKIAAITTTGENGGDCILTYAFDGSEGAVITGYFGAEPAGKLELPGTLGGRSMTMIGEGAFMGCTGLTEVTIPASVEVIEDGAFAGYAYINGTSATTAVDMALHTVTFADGSRLTRLGTAHASYGVFKHCERLANITLPDSVETIGSDAFSGCKNLKSFIFPSSLTRIARFAFEGTGLTGKITLPEGVRGINNAFSGTDITEIVLPAGMTSISSSAFAGCMSLTAVTLPANLTTIGVSAFAGCTRLTAVTLPANLTTIGANAFHSCTSLPSDLTIPAQQIGNGAFQGCTSLVNVTLSNRNGSTVLGDDVFGGCTSLQKVFMPGFSEGEMKGCVGAFDSPAMFYVPGVAAANGKVTVFEDANLKIEAKGWYRAGATLNLKTEGLLINLTTAQGTLSSDLKSITLPVDGMGTPLRSAVIDLMPTFVNITTTGGGAVSSSSNAEDQTITLTATPDEGCVFLHWKAGGVAVTSDNPYTFKSGAHSDLVAVFAKVDDPADPDISGGAIDDLPKTDDESQIGLWMALLAASFGAVALIRRRYAAR